MVVPIQISKHREDLGRCVGGTYIEPPYLHVNGYLAGYSCTLYSNYQQKRTIMLFANNLSYAQLRAINSQLYHAYFGDYREEQATINAD